MAQARLDPYHEIGVAIPVALSQMAAAIPWPAKQALSLQRGSAREGVSHFIWVSSGVAL